MRWSKPFFSSGSFGVAGLFLALGGRLGVGVFVEALAVLATTGSAAGELGAGSDASSAGLEEPPPKRREKNEPCPEDSEIAPRCLEQGSVGSVPSMKTSLRCIGQAVVASWPVSGSISATVMPL